VFVRVPLAWSGAELEARYADALAEATRQTSRVGAVITAIDKVHLNDVATAGHVTTQFHFFKHNECPSELWRVCMHLKEFLDQDLTFLAPSPPF
jgi:hypothetical protein